MAFADSSLDAELPEFEKLLVIVRPGDTVVVPSMDRLARTVEELRDRICRLIELGACVEFLAEKTVFSNENGLSAFGLLSVFGAFNEFRQAILRERQQAKARRRKQWMALRRVLTSRQIEELRRRAKSGEEKKKMAREYGISRWTLYKYLRDGAADSSG